MHYESTDKFHIGKSNNLLLVGSIIFSMKRNFFLVNRNNSCIRDSNAIGIASKIFNGISVTVESFFDFGIPVCGIKFVLEFVPCIMVVQLFAWFRKIQFIFWIVLMKIEQKLTTEFLTKGSTRTRNWLVQSFKSIVWGKPPPETIQFICGW